MLKLGRKMGVSEAGSQFKFADYMTDELAEKVSKYDEFLKAKSGLYTPTGFRMTEAELDSESVKPMAALAAADPFPGVSPFSSYNWDCNVADWGMLGNDQYGDCGVAGDVHFHECVSWVGKYQPTGNITTAAWPTAADTIKAYFTYEGSPGGAPNSQYDAGVDLGQWLLNRLSNPIGPIPAIKGFAQVNVASGAEYQAALAISPLYCGINVNNEMMNEYPGIWTSTATDWVGGHCVVHVGRNANWGECITWGTRQRFTWPNWRATREEAYIILTEAQVANAVNGVWNGINVQKLISDLNALGGTVMVA